VDPSPSADRDAESAAHRAAEAEVRACLEEQGFAVVEDHEGGWGVEEPSSDAGQEDFQSAFKECQKLFPATVPPTEEEMRTQYAALLDVAACLEEIGYPQTTQPPSEEVFVADYQHLLEQGGGNLWHPYMSLPPQVIASVEDECPQP